MMNAGTPESGKEACLTVYRKSTRFDRQSTVGRGNFTNHKIQIIFNSQIQFPSKASFSGLPSKNDLKGGDI
jgi:hypothetical protein